MIVQRAKNGGRERLINAIVLVVHACCYLPLSYVRV